MITTKIEYYIKHAETSYLVSYDVVNGVTAIMQWEQHKTMFILRDSMPFVCDDRKAAEIYLQGFINYEKRKI